MKKNWIIEIGILSIAGLLAGCSQKDSPLDLNNEISAKGRYVEETIEIPHDLQNNRYIDCLVYDNKMEILSYSKEKDQYYSYIYDNLQWNTEQVATENMMDDITIRGFAKNADNEKYFYGYDENKDYHILSTNQDTPALLSTELSGLSAKDGAARIDKVVFHNNGSILVSIQDKAILFTEDGVILHEFAQDYNDGTTRESAFLSDTAYVTVLNQKLVSYSLKDGEMRELNSNQNVDIWSCIFTDKPGSVYIANMDGLYHINDNSTIVEKVIEGNLNSMSLQSDLIRKFFETNQDTYYCVMNNLVNDNISFLKYTYNPDLSTLPQDTITVYSLNDSPTLRQSAAFMQRQNPNIRVDIRIAMGVEYESLSEDIIRSLNAELLNGKGADVLVLDGLPKDAYMEKGVLLNLQELFLEIQEESAILPNIMQNYVDSQGDIYYLPVRFKMPVVFGEKDAVEMLSQMALTETKENAIPILAADNYGNLERLILNICYKQVFTSGNNELSEESLKTYLKCVKTLGEKIQAKVEFAPEEMELLEVDNYFSKIGNRRNNAVAFAQHKTQIGFESIGSLQDSILTLAALKEKQLEMETIDGIFYPELVVGINRNTKNQELAKEFLKVLYSGSVQNQDLSDGFAVLESSVLHWENVERDTKMVISDYDGSTILSASWPEKENRIKIIEMIKLLKTPMDIDPTIMSIITKYSRSYYDGIQDLDTTVNQITNKVSLYNEE